VGSGERGGVFTSVRRGDTSVTDADVPTLEGVVGQEASVPPTAGEQQRGLHGVRTALSTATGALTGAVVGFYGGGWLATAAMSGEPGFSRGLAGLGIALLTAVLGTIAGAAAAVSITLRDACGRGVTVTTVLVGGLPLSALGAAGIGWLLHRLGFLPDTRLAIVLAAVVFLPATALLGRWIALRRHPDDAREH
jgi:hypothetical protein